MTVPGASHKKLCRQSAVGQITQVVHNPHLKLRRQPYLRHHAKLPPHTAASSLNDHYMPVPLTMHRQSSPHRLPTRNQQSSTPTRHQQSSPGGSPTRYQLRRSALFPVKAWVQHHAARILHTASPETSGSPPAATCRSQCYESPSEAVTSALAIDTLHSKYGGSRPCPAATAHTKPATASSRRHSCAGLPQVSAKNEAMCRLHHALHYNSRSRSDNSLNMHTAVDKTHLSKSSAPVHSSQGTIQPLRQQSDRTRSTDRPAGPGKVGSSNRGLLSKLHHQRSLQNLLHSGQPTHSSRGLRRHSLQESLTTTTSINGDHC